MHQRHNLRLWIRNDCAMILLVHRDPVEQVHGLCLGIVVCLDLLFEQGQQKWLQVEVAIKEPELLVGPYLTREAVSSSRIEGTEASLSDVLQAEVSDTAQQSDDIAEVTLDAGIRA